MQARKFKIVYALMLFLSVLMITSCGKETTIKDTPDQLFRPVISAGISNNTVAFSWVPIANATYSLEISRDSFKYVNDVQSFKIDGAKSYYMENLWSQTRYSARIKAVSKDGSVKDSGYEEITFVTGTENIFYTVSSNDISTNSVLLKWDKSKNVSMVTVLKGSVIDNSITLSPADISAGQRLIEGLTGNTSYVFKIYFGGMLRGTLTVKTK